MRGDKKAAFKLRREGKSYNEIAEALRISKGTLSEWLKPFGWSRRIQAALRDKAKNNHIIRLRFLNKVRGENLRKVYQEAKREAHREFGELKYHPLFIAGVVIYWGEGDKISAYNARIANTDPTMIKLFVGFLRDVCGVPPARIKAWILIYPDLSAEVCKKFWIEKTGLKSENFTKCITIKGRHKTRRLHHGVCNVGISSKYFKKKILVWLELLPAQLLQKRYYAGIV